MNNEKKFNQTGDNFNRIASLKMSKRAGSVSVNQRNQIRSSQKSTKISEASQLHNSTMIDRIQDSSKQDSFMQTRSMFRGNRSQMMSPERQE